MHGPKPYEFIRFGGIHAPNPIDLKGLVARVLLARTSSDKNKLKSCRHEAVDLVCEAFRSVQIVLRSYSMLRNNASGP